MTEEEINNRIDDLQMQINSLKIENQSFQNQMNQLNKRVSQIQLQMGKK